MNLYLRTLILIGLLILSACESKDKAEKTNDPVKIADKWLRLIDQGKLEQSWNETSQRLQKMVTKEQWVEQITSITKQLGKVNNRSLREQKKQKDYNSDAEQLILIYKGTFEKQNYVAETVVMIQENGQWQVLGYEAR